MTPVPGTPGSVKSGTEEVKKTLDAFDKNINSIYPPVRPGPWGVSCKKMVVYIF